MALSEDTEAFTSVLCIWHCCSPLSEILNSSTFLSCYSEETGIDILIETARTCFKLQVCCYNLHQLNSLRKELSTVLKELSALLNYVAQGLNGDCLNANVYTHTELKMQMHQ